MRPLQIALPTLLLVLAGCDRGAKCDTCDDTSTAPTTTTTTATTATTTTTTGTTSSTTSSTMVVPTAVNTRAHFPLEVLNWDMTRAYPGIEYNWRMAVKGGQYPYGFALSGPVGMSIDGRGVITWTPAATAPAQSVTVTIVDNGGAQLVHSFDVQVTEDNFFFVDPNGDDTGPGTQANPWQSLTQASAAGPLATIYVRAGTYDTNGLTLNGSDLAKQWLAYPNERPVWDFGGGIVGVSQSESVIYGFGLQNAGAKMFWGSGSPDGLIWRDNEMHGVASTGFDNPAHIFFEDGYARPVDGDVQYNRVVIQDNVFYDLTNPNDHGASVTCYNVKNLLYEDNEAYDIDGRGLSDKDDGFQNTIRNNHLHDLNGSGVGLYSQYSQAEIEVSFNLIYNVGDGVTIGSQPGYIRDVWVHHNTLVDEPIKFGSVTDCATCEGYEIYRNIISTSDFVYSIYPVGDNGGYRYPGWADAGNADIDDNLIWTTSDVAGYSWGLTNEDLADWQLRGFDVNSEFADPLLEADYSLPAGSAYAGFGR